jgi:methionine-S-sulfoxide reductase
MKKAVVLAISVVFLFAVAGIAQNAKQASNPGGGKAQFEKATFAGGCFWCMQPPFDSAKGVVSTVVGYSGGKEKKPTYEEVSAHATGHLEAIEVTYDPKQISYAQLVEIFFRNIDPTQANGQFADIGPQYKTAIFFHNEEQKRVAQESKEKLAQSGRFSNPIVVQILPASRFWPAEEYHQKYYLKNPEHYNSYAYGSGRKPFLERTWGKH